MFGLAALLAHYIFHYREVGGHSLSGIPCTIDVRCDLTPGLPVARMGDPQVSQSGFSMARDCGRTLPARQCVLHVPALMFIQKFPLIGTFKGGNYQRDSRQFLPARPRLPLATVYKGLSYVKVAGKPRGLL